MLHCGGGDGDADQPQDCGLDHRPRRAGPAPPQPATVDGRLLPSNHALSDRRWGRLAAASAAQQLHRALAGPCPPAAARPLPPPAVPPPATPAESSSATGENGGEAEAEGEDSQAKLKLRPKGRIHETVTGGPAQLAAARRACLTLLSDSPCNPLSTPTPRTSPAFAVRTMVARFAFKAAGLAGVTYVLNRYSLAPLPNLIVQSKPPRGCRGGSACLPATGPALRLARPVRLGCACRCNSCASSLPPSATAAFSVVMILSIASGDWRPLCRCRCMALPPLASPAASTRPAPRPCPSHADMFGAVASAATGLTLAPHFDNGVSCACQWWPPLLLPAHIAPERLCAWPWQIKPLALPSLAAVCRNLRSADGLGMGSCVAGSRDSSRLAVPAPTPPYLLTLQPRTFGTSAGTRWCLTC